MASIQPFRYSRGYSNYPYGIRHSSIADITEVGILETGTWSKTILDVNTNKYGLSINVCPTWSPDDKHLIYGSSKGPVEEPPGAKGAFSLYLIKNVK